MMTEKDDMDNRARIVMQNSLDRVLGTVSCPLFSPEDNFRVNRTLPARARGAGGKGEGDR